MNDSPNRCLLYEIIEKSMTGTENCQELYISKPSTSFYATGRTDTQLNERERVVVELKRVDEQLNEEKQDNASW